MFTRVSLGGRELLLLTSLSIVAFAVGSSACDPTPPDTTHNPPPQAGQGSCYDANTSMLIGPTNGVSQSDCEGHVGTGSGICPTGHTCIWTANQTPGAGARRGDGEPFGE